jgi:hypothetical protein
MPQGELGAEHQGLHQRALAAPAAHQQAWRSGSWVASGTATPEAEQFKLEGRNKELQADYEAVTIAIGRTLDDKFAYVQGTADG